MFPASAMSLVWVGVIKVLVRFTVTFIVFAYPKNK
jgi:hypothetical protein